MEQESERTFRSQLQTARRVVDLCFAVNQDPRLGPERKPVCVFVFFYWLSCFDFQGLFGVARL